MSVWWGMGGISPQVITGGPWWAWSNPIMVVPPFQRFFPPAVLPVPVPRRRKHRRRDDDRSSTDVLMARMPPREPRWGMLWFNTELKQMFIYDGASRRWEATGVPEAPLDGGTYSRRLARWVVSPGGIAVGFEPPPGSPGAMWFDGAQLRIWYNGTWQPVGGGGGATIELSATPPTNPAAGTMWFDPSSTQLFVWYDDGDSQQWVVVTNQATGGAGVVVSDTAPSAPLPGAMWFDRASQRLYLWYEGQWVLVSGVQITAGTGIEVT